MLKNRLLQIILLAALISPIAQADPGGPDCGGGQIHSVEAPQLIFREPFADNTLDGPKYRNGFYQDSKTTVTPVKKAHWRVYAVDREEPKSTSDEIKQTIKDWLKDKALSALAKVADYTPLGRVIKNADKTADAIASGDWRRGIWVTYVLEGPNGEILDTKVEKLSGDDELPWQLKGGDAPGQQKVLKTHLSSLDRTVK